MAGLTAAGAAGGSSHVVEVAEEAAAEELVGSNQVVAQAPDGTVFYLYKHQAGGHKPFLRSADGSVCKPAIALELQFYETLTTSHPQLAAFVPPFVGKVSVELNLSQGLTVPSTTIEAGVSVDGGDKQIPAAAEGEEVVQCKTHSKSPRIPHPSIFGKKRRLVRSTSNAGYSATLWRKERSSSVARGAATNASGSTAQLQNYLVLGDLTRGFRRPCVLDIKMGTRQHGADATPAKAASHSAKCAATTSLELGLRLCGMQIYDAELDEYMLWDKHWGRRLKAADIEPALATYLTCGEHIRWEILERLLSKVQRLRDVISSTRGLRFWGSSLLLIYEGDCRDDLPTNVDVRLIDFAHCQMSVDLDSPDDGLLLGLANIATFLQSLQTGRKSGASN